MPTVNIIQKIERMQMHKLGASLFIHNGLKYDYCLKESILSVLELCDEVIVLEADSEDDTLDFLHTMSKEHPKLKVYDHGVWECATDYNRLSILANQARELLSSEWHFMIQADEVLHESSFNTIRKLIHKDDGFDRYGCRRVNLFKDFNHYIRFDIDQSKKPCSDIITRLGKKEVATYGDAESLIPTGQHTDKHVNEILIFHYGMVRKRDVLLDKAISMQGWFFANSGMGIDPKLIEMKEKYGELKPEEIKPDSELDKLKWEHPKFATEWVREREAILAG